MNKNDQRFYGMVAGGAGIILLPLLGFLIWNFSQRGSNQQNLPVEQEQPANSNTGTIEGGNQRLDQSTYQTLNLQSGRVYTESVSLQRTVSMAFGSKENDGDKGRQEIAERLSGTLEIRSYQFDDGLAFLGYRFRDVSLSYHSQDRTLTSSNHKEVRKKEADLRNGFFLEKTPSGNIKSVYFPDLTGDISVIMQLLTFIKDIRLPDDFTLRSWMKTGSNPIGVYQAQFRKQSRGDQLFITRTLERYSSINVTSERPSRAGVAFTSRKHGYTVSKLSNDTTYTWSSSRGYPLEVLYQDTTKIKHGKQSYMLDERNVQAELEIENISNRDPQTLRQELFDRWNVSSIKALKEKLRSVPPGRTIPGQEYYSPQEQKKAWEAFQDLLPRLRSLSLEDLKKGQFGKYMVNAVEYARKNPRILEEMDRIIRNDKNPFTKRFGLDLLTAVGNDKSQELLGNIITDTRLSQKLRTRAMKSAVFLEAPNKSMRERVKRLLRSEDVDAKLQGHAIRFVGSASHQFQSVDQELSDEMFQTLKQFAEQDLEKTQKVAMSDALANTGRDDAIPMLKKYASERESEPIRTTAIANLARRKDDQWTDEAFDTLLEMDGQRTAQYVGLQFFLKRDWRIYSRSFRMEVRKKLQKLEKQTQFKKVRELARRIRNELEKSLQDNQTSEK